MESNELILGSKESVSKAYTNNIDTIYLRHLIDKSIICKMNYLPVSEFVPETLPKSTIASSNPIIDLIIFNAKPRNFLVFFTYSETVQI